MHHYPIDANTMMWGLAIGAGAMAATAASAAALRVLPLNRTPLVLALILACAYGAYELVLFAVTPVLGGARRLHVGDYRATWLFERRLAHRVVAACEIVRLINPFRRGQAVST